MKHYILEGTEPVEVKNYLEWMFKFQNSHRILNETQLGSVKVITAFLGTGKHLFCTQVFGKMVKSEYYDTYGEAMKGHNKVVKLI